MRYVNAMWKESIQIVLRGDLEAGATAYPMRLQPFENNNRRQNAILFHFAMWLSANPNVSNFRVIADGAIAESPIVEVGGYTLWIMFGERKDRSAFTRWMARYSKWFGGVDPTTTFMPELPENGQIRICIVSTSFTKYDVFNDQQFPDGFVERWSWIITNCRKPVYVMPQRGFAFTDVKEAVHYKLHFGVE